MLWVPEGFGHAFCVLSETADFLYKTTDYYAPEYDRCIIWNDLTLESIGRSRQNPVFPIRIFAAFDSVMRRCLHEYSDLRIRRTGWLGA